MVSNGTRETVATSFTPMPGNDRKAYVAVKLEPDASELLHKASYELTGTLKTRVTLSEAVRILYGLLRESSVT
jgi:hypothetical protein